MYSENGVKFVRNNGVLLHKTLQNGVYVFEIKVKSPDADKALYANSIENWHKKLGHISLDNIKYMASHKIVDSLNICEGEKLASCADCALGKCRHSSDPYRCRLHNVEPGQILHLDTVGPITPHSINANQYFVLAKDEHSGYRMAAYVSTKKEVSNQVKLMVTESKLATGNNVLKICTDNGRKFLNQDLSPYLKSNGIIHDTSLPYVHQQNGLVERVAYTVI